MRVLSDCQCVLRVVEEASTPFRSPKRSSSCPPPLNVGSSLAGLTAVDICAQRVMPCHAAAPDQPHRVLWSWPPARAEIFVFPDHLLCFISRVYEGRKEGIRVM